MAKRITRAKRPTRPGLRPTDKWIVGWIDPRGAQPELKMFVNPRVFDNYDKAVTHAETQYAKYGSAFVVFAKKCVIGPSRPPILKQEYLA